MATLPLLASSVLPMLFSLVLWAQSGFDWLVFAICWMFIYPFMVDADSTKKLVALMGWPWAVFGMNFIEVLYPSGWIDPPPDYPRPIRQIGIALGIYLLFVIAVTVRNVDQKPVSNMRKHKDRLGQMYEAFRLRQTGKE